MASVNYNSMKLHMAKADINFAADTFKALLVTSAYVPDVDTHEFRSSVTNEVTGAGYTAGGVAVTCTVTQDNANNQIVIAFGQAVYPAVTVTARGAVIYKSRGGAASADELIAYADFGANASSSGGDYEVTFDTPIYLGDA